MSGRLRSLILASVLATACSNEQFYISMQKRGQAECRQLPEEQFEECFAAYQKTWDEYQRELEQARETR